MLLASPPSLNVGETFLTRLKEFVFTQAAVEGEDGRVGEIELTPYRLDVTVYRSVYIFVIHLRLDYGIYVADGVDAASSCATSHLVILAGFDVILLSAVEFAERVEDDGASGHIDADCECLSCEEDRK